MPQERDFYEPPHYRLILGLLLLALTIEAIVSALANFGAH